MVIVSISRHGHCHYRSPFTLHAYDPQILHNIDFYGYFLMSFKNNKINRDKISLGAWQEKMENVVKKSNKSLQSGDKHRTKVAEAIAFDFSYIQLQH